MFKKAGITVSKYFFLLLFLGFLGSITLFNHAHVVNGVTIIHSHPFKSGSNGKPLHSHTDQGFLTIHLLSVISIVSIISFFTLESLVPSSYKIVPQTRPLEVNNLSCLFRSLRAPPSDILT